MDYLCGSMERNMIDVDRTLVDQLEQNLQVTVPTQPIPLPPPVTPQPPTPQPGPGPPGVQADPGQLQPCEPRGYPLPWAWPAGLRDGSG
eukprot:10133498-Prorocentrum_lima.AAC.1